MNKRFIAMTIACLAWIGLRAETWSLYFWSDVAYEADKTYSGTNYGPFVETSETGVFTLNNVIVPTTNLKYCIHNANWSINYGWSELHDGIIVGIGETIKMGSTTQASGWCPLPPFTYNVVFNANDTTIRFDLVKQEGKKKISILGDSYSTMYGSLTPYTNEAFFPRYDVQIAEQTWWYKVIKSGDYQLEVNNSYSGSTMTYNTLPDWHDTSKKMDISTSFIARASNLGNPDIILLCGGTNDEWNNDNSMGEYKYSDWTDDDLYLFRPGTAYLLNLVKTTYPEAQVIFILNDILPRVSESILTICEHYNIVVAQPKDIDKDESSHPSPDGMTTIANSVIDILGGEKIPTSTERVCNSQVRYNKIIKNGQILIDKDGISYTLLGTSIR